MSKKYGFLVVGVGIFLLVIIIGVLVAVLNLKRKRRRKNTGIIILTIHVFVICHKIEISLVVSYISYYYLCIVNVNKMMNKLISCALTPVADKKWGINPTKKCLQ